ncbi:unnamed protein product [Allacma fusca]|uniref:Uncharacterized protein n=1 Tax=Allacma fusca TaxID=39272 RepID=A0A8J2JLC7_9HEXA|nr:unnamed protein product [Allacma fusca]
MYSTDFQVDYFLLVFSFFKYIGVFPGKVTPPLNGKTKDAEAQHLPQVSILTKGIFAWLHRANICLFSIFFPFQLYRFFDSIFLMKSNFETLIRQSCWNISATIVFVVVIWICRSSRPICNTINSWKEVESHILEQISPESKVLYQLKRNCELRRASVYFFLMTLLSSIGIVYHCLSHPFYPMYIYSLFVETKYPLNLKWLILSALTQPIVLGYHWSFSFFLEMISTQFFASITSLLHLISTEDPNTPFDSDYWKQNPCIQDCRDKLNKNLPFLIQVQPVLAGKMLTRGSLQTKYEASVKQYQRLQSLVTQFNDTFKHTLFWHHTLMIIMLCLLFYAPMKELLNESIFSNVGFSLNAIFLLYRLYRVEVEAGKIHSASCSYINYWKGSMSSMLSRFEVHDPKELMGALVLREKLNQCHKFGILVGNFYVVKSGTVLTLGSIVTTYLIVLLQF